MFDSLWINLHAATMADAEGFGIIKNAAIGIKDKKIAWIGEASALPGKPEALSDYVYDGEGKWVTPALIDCHTNLIYGGGDEQELYDAALKRIRLFFHEGVTSFEIKSTDEKVQRVSARIRDDLGLRIRCSGTADEASVLLPGRFYFRQETELPPVDLYRKNETSMVIATGHDPDTTPVFSLLLMLNMACVLFRLTPGEALAAVTRHAARALGYTDIGTLEKNKSADFALWDITHPNDLSHDLGRNPCRGVVRDGEFYNFEIA